MTRLRRERSARKRIHSEAGAVSRPTQQLGLHVNAIHHTHRFRDFMRSTCFAICLPCPCLDPLNGS